MHENTLQEELKKITDSEIKFIEFCAIAEFNNKLPPEKRKIKYKPVHVYLENGTDTRIVPTYIYDKGENECKFTGWKIVDGEKIQISGVYDKGFKNSYYEFMGHYK